MKRILVVVAALLVLLAGAVFGGALFLANGVPLPIAFRTWTVTSMTGFGADNVAEGHLRFIDGDLKLDDGVNQMTLDIRWEHDGFTVVRTKATTTAAAIGPHSHLAELADPGGHVDVTLRGHRLTLTNGAKVVVAER
ncbi:hypothetical protein GCM10011584_23410 [Nocardioides phosphati]|uniref:Uncharacterized protein n=1 Tax=Nocardioides phosphati TaxID=1867775 RepID=A0ABQ2NCJ0_9ACTN|nr:hypothetical protein [Nocardioides phosphati]GGO90795.1 hypothetical protein GCM10011584_23410 [Nocardioides phosphati]